MTPLRNLAAKATRFGIKAEVLMLTFTIGAIVGMLTEAIAITVPKIALMLLGAGW